MHAITTYIAHMHELCASLFDWPPQRKAARSSCNSKQKVGSFSSQQPPSQTLILPLPYMHE